MRMRIVIPIVGFGDHCFAGMKKSSCPFASFQERIRPPSSETVTLPEEEAIE